MEKSISIENEIKIRDVKKIWRNIKKMAPPLNIDMKEIETADGTGLQLMFRILSEVTEKYYPI